MLRLFWLILLLKLVTILPKSVLLTYLTCFHLAVKFSAVNLLNSWVIIYLAWSGISFWTSLIFILRTFVVTKLLVSAILFLTFLEFVFKTVVATKQLVDDVSLATPSIFFSEFSLFVLYWFTWVKVVASSIFWFKLFIIVFSVLNLIFLTT